MTASPGRTTIRLPTPLRWVVALATITVAVVLVRATGPDVGAGRWGEDLFPIAAGVLTEAILLRSLFVRVVRVEDGFVHVHNTFSTVVLHRDDVTELRVDRRPQSRARSRMMVVADTRDGRRVPIEALTEVPLLPASLTRLADDRDQLAGWFA